jgi:hypothetical protein
MRRWKPQAGFGIWIALGLLIGGIAGIGYLGFALAQVLLQPPETWPVDLQLYSQFVALQALLVIAAVLLYRILAALTLNYELDRNGLYITWLGNRAVVPLAEIQTVDLGVKTPRIPLGPLQAIGSYWGRGRVENRELHLFSTIPPQRSLAICTPSAIFSISPAEREAFVQDLEQRRNLGSTKSLTASTQPSRIFLSAFWNDQTVRWLLMIAFALNVLLLGILAARYPMLASDIEMRFNELGEVAEFRPRHQVLFLPLAAFGLALFNTALGLLTYRQLPIGARLLQAASVLVQILFGIAIVTIIY